MRILIYALGVKALNVVKALTDSGLDISLACVVGRDSKVLGDYSGELIEYCLDRETPCCFREESIFEVQDFDYVFAVGWKWMIQGLPEHRLIVFHDSLLPTYRGFAPLVNALLNRESVVGVSAIWGAKEYDKGNIIAQKRMGVEYPTRIAAEIDRMADLYGQLALDVVRLLSREGKIDGCVQDETKASYSLWRDDDDYRIDWTNKAVDIEHFVACVGEPYLGATTVLNRRQVRIHKVAAKPDVRIENRMPGKVIFIEKGFPVIVCGEGLLLIEEAAYSDGQDLLPLPSFRIRFQ